MDIRFQNDADSSEHPIRCLQPDRDTSTLFAQDALGIRIRDISVNQLTTTPHERGVGGVTKTKERDVCKQRWYHIRRQGFG